MQDPKNRQYMFDLETRLRADKPNGYERQLRMVDTPSESPLREGPMSMGSMVMDGLVPRPALASVIADLAKYGDLDHLVELDDALKDAAAIDAYDQLVARGLIDVQAVERWKRTLAAL